MKWPDEVPVLNHTNICRDKIDGPRGQHCLLGWFQESTGFKWYSLDCKMKRFEKCVLTSAREVGADVRADDKVADVNDRATNSHAIVARVWNRAIARLGYVVGNPECDRNGKLKPVNR